MRIAICDDEKNILNAIAGVLEDYIQLKDIEITYDVFLSFDELIGKIPDYDLFFLDCETPDSIDGLEFARIIRRDYGYEKGIVFITSHTDFVYKAFEVRAYRYILKPVQANEVFEALDNYLSTNTEGKKLLVKVDGRNDVINLNDVYYMEVSRKDIYIYFNEGYVVCHRTIASLEKELDNLGFFRIHRSYIVNFDKIKSFDKRIVQLVNGEKIFMSPQKYNDFCERYLKWINKRND